jgi:hypothetical protein
MLLGSKNSR